MIRCPISDIKDVHDFQQSKKWAGWYWSIAQLWASSCYKMSFWYCAAFWKATISQPLITTLLSIVQHQNSQKRRLWPYFPSAQINISALVSVSICTAFIIWARADRKSSFLMVMASHSHTFDHKAERLDLKGPCCLSCLWWERVTSNISNIS